MWVWFLEPILVTWNAGNQPASGYTGSWSPWVWFLESFAGYCWGYQPQNHTTVFFAAARRHGADGEAAAKQLKIFLSSGWNCSLELTRDGVDIWMGPTMLCTWLYRAYPYLRCNMLQPYAADPIALFKSPQAKSLCQMLVQRGIRVNHHDVAWHSAQVMLESVRVGGRMMSKGKWLMVLAQNDLTTPKCGWFLLVQHLMFAPHPNRAKSSFTCAIYAGPDQKRCMLIAGWPRVTFPGGIPTWKKLVGRLVSTRSTTNPIRQWSIWDLVGMDLKVGTSKKRCVDKVDDELCVGLLFCVTRAIVMPREQRRWIKQPYSTRRGRVTLKQSSTSWAEARTPMSWTRMGKPRCWAANRVAFYFFHARMVDKKSAEWAVSSWRFWGLLLRERIFVWRVFVQICPESNSESQKIGCFIIWKLWKMKIVRNNIEPRKMVEAHDDMRQPPACSDLVVLLWGCFMLSGDWGQRRPRRCWKAAPIWKRLGVGMGISWEAPATRKEHQVSSE